jgi:hypothetical protein
MEFAEITEDPFTNKTNNYYLVIGIEQTPITNPSSPGVLSAIAGAILDPTGHIVSQMKEALSQDYVVVGTLSDEAFAHSWMTHREWGLIPPNFKMTLFAIAYGFWLTPKEVEQFILGRLSLKGGD